MEPPFLCRRIECRTSYGPYCTASLRHSRRDLRLDPALGRALWDLRKATKAKDGDLAFTSARGRRVAPSNLSERVLKPAARAAGVEWASFHTFRHTCASLLFNAEKWNPKQVKVWLGHHSPAFTLERYVHLLPADLPDPPGWTPTHVDRVLAEQSRLYEVGSAARVCF